ncbi:MAG: acetyltransferase [Magnetococcales bacterium]|nr:acetyltransferase [Magnetococcales bacterium]
MMFENLTIIPNHTDPLVLLGAGGHASVLLDALYPNQQKILGLYIPPDASVPPWGEKIPRISSDAALIQQFPPSAVHLIMGIGAVASNEKRKQLFTHYRNLGYRFASVVHPRHYCAQAVTIGEGCQLMAGSMIQPGTTLHDNVILNTGAIIDHDCQIESHVHIAPGAVLSGGVHVGSGAHIGTGAVVIQGIHIGSGALIAAGATVVNNIPENARVAGIPAKPVHSLR